jgi:hypothetical protein
MVKRIFFLFLYLFFVQLAFAQKPWRAKLFIHFLDSNNKLVTDTIWFGLDSLGDEGYQEGLDVIDTVGSVNKILSHDSLVQNQFNTDCGNLKYNIKKIKYGETRFDFYAMGRIMSMSWDTLDFLYEDTLNKYFASNCILRAYNGYIGGIDRVQFFLMAAEKNKIYFSKRDSIEAFAESPLSNCNRQFNVFAFSFTVAFFDKLRNLSIKETEKTNFLISPNPFKDNVKISFKNEAFHNKLNLKVHSITGKLVKETYLSINGNVANIDLVDLEEGIYILSIEDETNCKVSYHKIIKSNF